MSTSAPEPRDPPSPTHPHGRREPAPERRSKRSGVRSPPTPSAPTTHGGWGDLPLDPDVEVVAAPSMSARRRPGGRAEPRILLAISAGAVGGATARYKLATLIPATSGGFPWATFWTNVSGSLVLGFLLVLLIERFPPTRYARAFAGTGFLGAYTTFSTFSVETDVLLRDGHPATAAVYVVASLVVGVTVAWLGVVLGRRFPYHLLARRERS